MTTPETIVTTVRDLIGPTVAELAANGIARNEIARRIGVSPSTVSLAAENLGIKFDRAQTSAATAARVADFKARRVELAEKFAEVSDAILEAVNPRTPDARDLRDRLTAAGVSVDRHMKLALFDQVPDRDMSAVDAFAAAMLGEKADDDEPIDQAAIFAEIDASRPAHVDPVGTSTTQETSA